MKIFVIGTKGSIPRAPLDGFRGILMHIHFSILNRLKKQYTKSR